MPVLMAAFRQSIDSIPSPGNIARGNATGFWIYKYEY